ncbi:alpha/beta hydrolase [Vibrio sp. WXL103]|uniref:alpha/beta hydrolase n=1 Tax=Vibrio sp. WXL103 TaxID=3450710 RepID=UPI003EC8EC75
MQLTPDRFHIVKEFDIPQLGRKRTIRIYLPASYNNEGGKRYPVIYMHDGQNLFDSCNSFGGSSWEIPNNVDRFFAGREGVIVVGIDNGSEFDGLCRMYEYSPWKMDKNFVLSDWDSSVYNSGGDGSKYVSFITDTLKPYIDENYRTRSGRDHTAIAGSSMGGYISIFAVFERSDIFSMAGVFSPAFWFNKPEMFAYLSKANVSNPVKIYMDMGTCESSSRGIGFEKIYLDGSNEAEGILRRKENVRLKYLVDEGALHTETAWAKRYPEMLKFFFN